MDGADKLEAGTHVRPLQQARAPSLQLQANPTALASYGLGLEDLRTALAQANVNQAKGNFDGLRQAAISANDQLVTGGAYRPLIVAYRNGGPVRLSDVADVTDGVENATQAAWTGTLPAVIVNIQRQPGAKHHLVWWTASRKLSASAPPLRCRPRYKCLP